MMYLYFVVIFIIFFKLFNLIFFIIIINMIVRNLVVFIEEYVFFCDIVFIFCVCD